VPPLPIHSPRSRCLIVLSRSACLESSLPVGNETVIAMTAIPGYARVSTTGLDLDLQLGALTAAGVDERLRDRAAKSGAVAQQLASQFQRGEMKPSIFEPPDGADAVIHIDTSDQVYQVIETIEAAVVALLR
jgi:hypothetical protein